MVMSCGGTEERVVYELTQRVRVGERYTLCYKDSSNRSDRFVFGEYVDPKSFVEIFCQSDGEMPLSVWSYDCEEDLLAVTDYDRPEISNHISKHNLPLARVIVKPGFYLIRVERVQTDTSANGLIYGDPAETDFVVIIGKVLNLQKSQVFPDKSILSVEVVYRDFIQNSSYYTLGKLHKPVEWAYRRMLGLYNCGGHINIPKYAKSLTRNYTKRMFTYNGKTGDYTTWYRGTRLILNSSLVNKIEYASKLNFVFVDAIMHHKSRDMENLIVNGSFLVPYNPSRELSLKEKQHLSKRVSHELSSGEVYGVATLYSGDKIYGFRNETTFRPLYFSWNVASTFALNKYEQSLIERFEVLDFE